MYLDERAHPDQHAAPTDTFIGRAGGTTLTNFAKAIGEVYRVRPAQIRLNHDSGGQRIGVDDYVPVRALEPVEVDEPVACGKPGYDHPGEEYLCEVMHVDEPSLRWR